MILLDANLLLYAYNSSAEQHENAREWLEEVFSGHGPVALSWPTILAFLRITTHPRLPHALSQADAAQIVSEWLDRPQTYWWVQSRGIGKFSRISWHLVKRLDRSSW